MARRKKKAPVEESEPKRSPISPETRNSIIAVFLLAFTGIVILSLFSDAGVVGAYIKEGVGFLFGTGSFLFILSLLGAAVILLTSVHEEKHRAISIGLPFSVLGILASFEMLGQPYGRGVNGAGGFIGHIAAWPFLHYLGKTASVLIVIAVVISALLFTFDTPLKRFWTRGEGTEEDEEIPNEPDEEPEPTEEEGEDSVVFEASPHLPRLLAWFRRNREHGGQEAGEWASHSLSKDEASSPAPRVTLDGVREGHSMHKRSAKAAKKPKAPGLFPDGYRPPPLNFLESGTGKPSSGDIMANKNIIKRTLSDFGIKVDMQDVNVGPSITQYMLKPASGVNVSRITALRKNLSLALSAHPIRIEAPIPGKPFVGVEIPNRTASTVRLRSLIELLYKQKKKSSSLVFPLGRDVSGQPSWADLGRMPHLLIAGATGAGKSVAVNNIIISLLYTNSPATLRLLLVDPKRVELTPYNDIPHLLSPVVVDAKKTINVLKWALGEMDRRYQVLADAGSRDIVSYNAKVERAGGEDTLAYIVIVIDEMADLMSMYKKEVEAAVVRLAQMARAVGLHLIASTQRPSTDVVTGLIKANIPVRLAFKVASQVDSRTILDQAGAEKLLGHGDMLYMAGDSSGLKRIQGSFIGEKEVRRVTTYLRGLGQVAYDESVTKEQRSSTLLGGSDSGGADDDSLYEEAKQIAIEANKVSASLLQRRLRVGYARAARLLDMMEERGIIGPQEGSKPREVFIGSEESGDETFGS